MIIYKALYGLKSSGKRWFERLADTLRDLSFFISEADDSVWMRRNGDVYKYIALYVDDLGITARDPVLIVTSLKVKYKFKIKGDGPIDYHLGMQFYRDPDGTLCQGTKKYIDKIMQCYERHFNGLPKEFSSPLEKNDHPEIDDSCLLDHDDIKLYQSLIGELQWAVTIGHFNIFTAVMTMSRFRVAP